jgi:hypothetical protein
MSQDNFPIPITQDMLDTIGIGRPTVMSCMDLMSGFFQLELNEESKQYTAFQSMWSHYEFNRLPQGMKNSPATFQRCMTEAFSHMLNECLAIYIDDLLAYSTSLELHVQHLREVFEVLRKTGLRLKASKCHFFRDSLKFVGFLITPEGIKVDPKLVSDVVDFPVPRKVKHVRSFIGKSQFYRKFIRNYSKICRPLFDLFKKDAKFVWSKSCQDAFDTLKKHLVQAPILAHADFNSPFRLYTDASDHSVGFVLTQDDSEGVERVISYAGKSLHN